MALWQPSVWARLCRRTMRWELELDRIWLRISSGEARLETTVGAARHPEVRRGRLWTTLVLTIPRHGPVELSGIRRQDAAAILGSCSAAVVEQDRLNRLEQSYKQAGVTIRAWWDQVSAEWVALKYRWIPLETVRARQQAKPSLDSGFLDAKQEPLLQDFLSPIPEETQAAIQAWQHKDLGKAVAERNEKFLQHERQELAEYFNTVEKSPLTDEQIDAVVRFDNRVRVIAAAGSGYTT